jgi:hypothetical protein
LGVGIFERTRIKGFFLWMECGPCVVYERKWLRRGFPSLLYEFTKQWKREKLYEKKKSNAKGCVKVVGLDVFFKNLI